MIIEANMPRGFQNTTTMWLYFAWFEDYLVLLTTLTQFICGFSFPTEVGIDMVPVGMQCIFFLVSGIL